MATVVILTVQNKTILMDILSNIQWLHVLVAAIAYFMLGAVWYSFLFQKQWVAYHKIDMNDPDAKKGAGAIMAFSFLLFFVICICLDILVNRLGLTQVISGVKLGLFTGIGFSAMAISITYLYLQKHRGLHFIDGLYHTVGQVIAAVILCAWH
jgi:hypothetical protein